MQAVATHSSGSYVGGLLRIQEKLRRDESGLAVKIAVDLFELHIRFFWDGNDRKSSGSKGENS